MTEINKNRCIKDLACAVVHRALLDYKVNGKRIGKENPNTRIELRRWLLTGNCGLWCEFIGITPGDIEKLFLLIEEAEEE